MTKFYFVELFDVKVNVKNENQVFFFTVSTVKSRRAALCDDTVSSVVLTFQLIK